MKQARTWRFAAALTMLLGGMLLTASSTWENKDPSQWTREEIDQILHKSAWVKQTNASLDRSEMQQDGGHSGQSGRMGGGGVGIPGIGFPGGGGMGGGMGRGGGGLGRGRGGGGRQMEQEPVVVRWDSALPVKQALQRNMPKDTDASDGGKASAGADSYIISVTGLRAPHRRRNSDDNDNANSAEDSQRRVKDELMISTRLIAKGRDPLSPSEVQLDSAGGTSEVRFIFPKKDPVSLDDKEVDFETRLGAAKVQAKFHPKDMKYKGKLEL